MIIDLDMVGAWMLKFVFGLLEYLVDSFVSLLLGMVVGVLLGVYLCGAATEEYRLNHRTVFITQKCSP